MGWHDEDQEILPPLVPAAPIHCTHTQLRAPQWMSRRGIWLSLGVFHIKFLHFSFFSFSTTQYSVFCPQSHLPSARRVAVRWSPPPPASPWSPVCPIPGRALIPHPTVETCFWGLPCQLLGKMSPAAQPVTPQVLGVRCHLGTDAAGTTCGFICR